MDGYYRMAECRDGSFCSLSGMLLLRVLRYHYLADIDGQVSIYVSRVRLIASLIALGREFNFF